MTGAAHTHIVIVCVGRVVVVGNTAIVVVVVGVAVGLLALDRRDSSVHVGENHPLLVVVLTQDLVLAEIEPIADAESAEPDRGAVKKE